MTRRTILLDLDHTLSHAQPRDHLMGDWDNYHAASINDVPLEDIVSLLTALADDDYTIIAITARPEKWRQLTMQWLLKHNVDVDTILMRPNDDYRKPGELKVALATEYFGDEGVMKDQVAFLLDDNDEVIAAFRGLGITTLHVSGRKS